MSGLAAAERGAFAVDASGATLRGLEDAMRMQTHAGFMLGLFGLVVAMTSPGQAAPLKATHFAKAPALVLVVVIDQLRGDSLTRHGSRLLPASGRKGRVGGLRYLMERGAWYPQAEHDVLHAMTGPGHATVLTGAWPYRTGIVLNAWWDRSKQRRQYCIDDANKPIVGVAKSRRIGASPWQLRGTTLGDEMKFAGLGSRVVTVSLKDRAAILLGGYRADLALWMNKPSFRWVSSRHYLAKGGLPAWVEKLNSGLKNTPRTVAGFKPLGRGDGRSRGDPTAMATIGKASGNDSALWTPLGPRITVDAAIAALEAFDLGRRNKATDLLAVSFSAHDIVGHLHGHDSRESEEILVATDRALARLLEAVRKRVPGGLDRVLIALTSDHGAPPTLATLKAARIPTGVIGDHAMTRDLEARLARRFGAPKGGKWIAYAAKLQFYLSPTAIAASKASAAEIEGALRDALLAHPQIEVAFTRSGFLAGKRPAGRWRSLVEHSYRADRGGNVVAIARAYQLAPGDASTHFTGYSYDRSVPLILAGKGIQPGVYGQRALVVDLAPTLALLLGITAPALSEGRVLHEALGSHSAGR